MIAVRKHAKFQADVFSSFPTQMHLKCDFVHFSASAVRFSDAVNSVLLKILGFCHARIPRRRGPTASHKIFGTSYVHALSRRKKQPNFAW